MKNQHQEILKLISDYLEKYPNQRFGQALFNLGVNEFIDDNDHTNYRIRDIHGDSDEKILERVKKRFERLY